MARVGGDGSTLQEALQNVSQALAEHKAWENGYDTIFEVLRRAILHGQQAQALDVGSDEQLEEGWLFLIEVRRRHKTRRKRVAECVQAVCTCPRWLRVYVESPRIQEAMAGLGEDAQAEFMQIVEPQLQAAAAPAEFGHAAPQDGFVPSAHNPWAAQPHAHPAAAATDPWSRGPALAAAPDPWAAAAAAPAPAAAGAHNPWGGAADPWAPKSPPPAAPGHGHGHSQSPQNPFAAAQAAKGGYPQQPAGGDAFGGGERFGAFASSGFPAAGAPAQHGADPFATNGFPGQPQGQQGPQSPWPDSEGFGGFGAAPGATANPKAKAGRQLFSEAYEAPAGAFAAGAVAGGAFGAAAGESARSSPREERGVSERIGEGIGTAVGKTRDFEQRHQVGARVADAGRNTVHAVKEANEKHDITGKIGRGTHTAVEKTREFDERHQVSAKVAETSRNAVQAARDANEKHDITGKVAHGTAVAARKTADASQQAFQAAREANQKHDITGKISHGASSAAHKTKEFEQRHQIGARTADAGRSAVQAAKEANEKHDITGKIGRGASSAASGASRGFAAVRDAASRHSSASPEPGAGGLRAPSAGAANPFGSPAPSAGAGGASVRPSSSPSPPGFNPFAAQGGGGGEQVKAQGGAFMAQMEKRSHGMQEKMAQKAMNAAVSKQTGGAVQNVPPEFSKAALGYAKQNPDKAAKFMQTAAKMAT